MFICEEDHNKLGLKGFHLFRDWGPCEICHKTTNTADCDCSVVKAEVDVRGSTVNKYVGRLNPDTGNPEILRDDKVLAVGSYEGFAFLRGTKNQACIVIGVYWEGLVPHEWIGVPLTVTLPMSEDEVLAELHRRDEARKAAKKAAKAVKK